MKSLSFVVVLTFIGGILAGCKEEPLDLGMSEAAKKAPPPWMSKAKAANNGGGAAMVVGPAPVGAGWKLGPPDVGGKLKDK
jgi:hypothetical protein